MFPRAARLWTLLCLVLALQLAAAQSFQVIGRQDDGGPTTTPASTSRTSTSTNTNTGDGKSAETSLTKTTSGAKTDAEESTSSVTKAPTGTAHSTPSPTATDPVDNSKFFNATIPAGQLPITPELTPGWGVAGVIMLATGGVYALVGIKNRWIHTFFSTAYMTALGVTVLIVYVMSVPVSNAVQGGYVVAVVLSGCAVGAVSMFFKELTEGLGCALGGFCVSMWLLCLVPGGLLHPVASKAIFVSCFTLVGLCFYFSRWTRDWALILMISFAGSTVTVLGIDCFSRAGLKEFWAYVWDVNGNLFPLGADTYPITKGIRVETAAIIIFFLVGIISQIKLWRIVREKRERRAAERAEGRRDLDLEEENVGRQVEEANARERRHWERVYGDGTSADESRMSDLGDNGSEKRLRRSDVEAIEMADMSESEHSRNGPNALMAAGGAQDGKVTVRVAADDIPGSPTDVADDMDEKAAGMDDMAASPTGDKRLSQRTTASKRVSQAQTVTEAPEVVPLPFTVPPGEDTKTLSDRSSIATFADDVETAAPARPRHSLVKRLSRGSATLLRSFSQGSGRGGGDDLALENGESSEGLVVPRSCRHDADNGSLAATVDGESVSGADRHSVHSTDVHRNIEINAELAEAEKPETRAADDEGEESRPLSQAVAADPADSPAEQSGVASPPVDALPAASEKAKSMASVASTPVSLTKDRLPRSLSRVAMSYRTNEWAKHLSYADTPSPDDVRVDEAALPVKAAAATERSVPVNVEDLQKTAEDGAPAPAMRRPESQISNVSYVPSVGKRVSKKGAPSSVVIPTHVPQDGEQGRSPVSPPSAALPPAPGPVRSASGAAAAMRRTSSGFDPIVEERHPATPVKDTILEETTGVRTASASSSLTSGEAPPRAIPGVVSYASPQTLIGQREMFLRSKSQGSLLSVTPDPPFAAHGPGSDAASLHNYPAYAAALSVPDPDDLPLSQRKEIMRRGSLMSLSQQSNVSGARLLGAGGLPHDSTESLPFNSHQPKRASTLPAQVIRDAQLATFRQSVQQDLRAGSPLVTPSGRETPFAASSLLGNREAEVQRNIEMQRNVLMGQKEAEAQRKEAQRREKEFVDRAFDERMRSGDLLEVHREAMRKMQNGARRS